MEHSAARRSCERASEWMAPIGSVRFELDWFRSDQIGSERIFIDIILVSIWYKFDVCVDDLWAKV